MNSEKMRTPEQIAQSIQEDRASFAEEKQVIMSEIEKTAHEVALMGIEKKLKQISDELSPKLDKIVIEAGGELTERKEGK